MPGTVTTIDRGQREGLYELVRNHLGSIEDFFVALERTKDFAKAEQLAVEFAEDFRSCILAPFLSHQLARTAVLRCELGRWRFSLNKL